MIYNSIGKRISQNLAGQVIATAWGCCHKDSKTQPDGSTTIWDHGDVVREISVSGVTDTYAYDALNRQVSHTNGRGSTSQTQYDAYGRTAGYTLNNVRQTTIGYDAATGRIATMLANGSNVPFTWFYLPGSDLKSSLAYPNGLTASWTYDANGQLLQVRNATPADVISQYDYTYDAAGRRNEIARSGSAMSESRTDAYGYNVRNELTSATKTGGPQSPAAEYAYQYDDIGNRITSTDLGTNRTYTANSLNQYSAITTSDFGLQTSSFEPQFDDDGNQTLIKTATGIWSVSYNGENRPVLWTRASDGATVSMAFDRMGRRVRYSGTGGAAVGSVMTFAYDGYVCVARRRHGTGGALDVDRFVWDPAEPVATRPLVFYVADSAPQYYAHDGSKNVSELVSADGAVSAHYEYAPFGAVTYSAGPSAEMCENCLDKFKSNVKSGSIPVGMPTVMFLPGTSRLVDGWLNGNN